MKLLPNYVMGVDIEVYDTSNIYRCESGGNIGWYLKIERSKKKLQKQYLDKMHQDSALLALHNAMTDRDEFKANNMNANSIGFQVSGASNSMLGVPGVTFHRKRSNQSEGFSATYTIERDGEIIKTNKAFSIPQHGFENALRLAIKTRKDWEKEQLEKAGVDPLQLRLAGRAYLDEEMAFKKIMAHLKPESVK